MKKLLIATFATLSIAGCTATQKGAVVGGAGGAAVGAAVSGGDTGSTLAGAAIGAAAGALVGRASEPGMCIYEDSYGNRYTAECPS